MFVYNFDFIVHFIITVKSKFEKAFTTAYIKKSL